MMNYALNSDVRSTDLLHNDPLNNDPLHNDPQIGEPPCSDSAYILAVADALINNELLFSDLLNITIPIKYSA